MKLTVPPRQRRQPKREEAREQLVQLAQKLGPGSQLPTFLSLCETLQISKGTLDSVLTDLEKNQLVERRHGVGLFVSTQVRKPILLLCSQTFSRQSSVSDFWKKTFEQLNVQAESLDFELKLHVIDEQNYGIEDNRNMLQRMEDERAQGVISIGCNLDVTEGIELRHVPLVAFAGYASCMVSLDTTYSLSGGVWHLVQQGCKNIGLWTDVPDSESGPSIERATRIRQFQEALSSNGLLYLPELSQVLGDIADATPTGIEEQGYRLAMRIFTSFNHVPDGLLITHDHLTGGAIRALDELRIPVGEQIHIASYANRGSNVLRTVQDRLILMEYDPAQIARELFEMLQDSMEGKLPTGGHRYVRPLPISPKNK